MFPRTSDTILVEFRLLPAENDALDHKFHPSETWKFACASPIPSQETGALGTQQTGALNFVTMPPFVDRLGLASTLQNPNVNQCKLCGTYFVFMYKNVI